MMWYSVECCATLDFLSDVKGNHAQLDGREDRQNCNRTGHQAEWLVIVVCFDHNTKWILVNSHTHLVTHEEVQ